MKVIVKLNSFKAYDMTGKCSEVICWQKKLGWNVSKLITNNVTNNVIASYDAIFKFFLVFYAEWDLRGSPSASARKGILKWEKLESLVKYG